MPFRLISMLITALLAAGCTAPDDPPAPAQEATDNPFLQDWDTPFGVPPFSAIETSHFPLALDEGMRINREEVQAIADNEAPPSFENTVEALDASGRLLTRTYRVFTNLVGSSSSPELQLLQAEYLPKIAKHNTDIFLNEQLFDRVRSIYEQRDALNLSDEQRYMVQRTFSDFERAGAALDQPSKDRLNEINQEISALTVKYAQNLLAENSAYQLVLETDDDLAGLPDFVLAAAAEAARERDLEGKFVFTLSRSSMTPFLQFSERRDLRQQIFTAWTQRGDQNNEYDNKEIVSRVTALRVERAQLLGYETHAHWVLADRMSGTPENAYAFLEQIWQPALAKAKQERAALQSMIESEGGDFDLAPWDWFFYTEKVRKARYDIDEETLKPYFQLKNVRDAAFRVANRLWGITFTELEGMPKYNDDLQVFEVKDADGSHLAVFYFDFHARQNKRGGAWMSAFRLQSGIDGGVTPIVINNTNFAKGAEGTPTLLSFRDAQTLFHEFGHGLHGALSNVNYELLSGTAGPRDYTEFPAQMMEHWISSREVLKETAIHYQTGDAIPDELIDRLLEARKFNQGYVTVEYLAAAYLDMAWHTLNRVEQRDVNAFEQQEMNRIGMLPEIVVRYRSTYFRHILSSAVGYSAGYYSYIWSEILDSDGFAAFEESGDLYDQKLAERLRTHVYSAGRTADAMELYTRFRGRKPTIDALLEGRGLNDVPGF